MQVMGDCADELNRRAPCQALHGDGLLEFQGSAHELFHLTAIVLQLVIALTVGQVKFLKACEFDLEFCDLLKGESGVAGLRFASEHLADEDREGAAVREHGPVQDFDRQTVAQLAARNQAIPVAAGIEAPREKCQVLGWSGAMTSDVATCEHPDDLRVGRRAFNPSVFVTAAEDVGLMHFLGFRFFAELDEIRKSLFMTRRGLVAHKYCRMMPVAIPG